ncbi:MAG: malonyl-ACP O-methyltransferase BioC [Steroidobacteraceae bacterium]
MQPPEPPQQPRDARGQGGPPGSFQLDRAGVRRSFERASLGYDAAAVLQARVRAELLDRLRLIRVEPALVLDLGCGTGEGARQLKRRYPRARTLALDIAPGMLREARRRSRAFRRFERVCGDAYRLPLADASTDLIFSNLLLQWCDAPDAVLAEIRRVLRAGGFFTFSTLGPDTLSELRAAWTAADDATHVNAFLDMHDVGDALTRAGFAEPVLDVERFTLCYADVHGLTRDLKAVGAHNVTAARNRGLTGRGKWRAMTDTYETFRRDGRLPATYEVIYGAAWSREARTGSGQGESAAPVGGEVRISPASIRRRLRP